MNEKNLFLFKRLYIYVLFLIFSPMFLVHFLDKIPAYYIDSFEILNISIGKIAIFLLQQSKFSLYIFIFILLLFIIRKVRKGQVFHKGKIRLDISPFHLYLAKCIGYNTISLVRVPISLQFKIIIDDIFECILTGSHEDFIKDISVHHTNQENKSKEVNLALSDTYKVKVHQIPKSKKKLPTVWIDSNINKDGVRAYNLKFIKEIKHQVHLLEKKYKTINIFAHTNTKHNKKIIEGAFKKGGQSGFDNINVYNYYANVDKFHSNPTKIL